jgi:hypothetical protein
MKVLSKTAFRNPFVLASFLVVGFLVVSSLTLAQTTPVVPAVSKKLAPAPAKPATAVKPATAKAVPVAAKQLAAPVQAAPSNGQSSIGSASGAATTITNQGLQPASLVSPLTSQTTSSPAGTVSNALASTGSTSTGSTPTGSNSTGSTATGSTPGDPRTPVAGQGIGTFLWPGGWTLTAYGCFRTGTRLFCDFDTTNQNNLSANTTIWSGAGGVNLVDDGGKITQRHNAFFVGQDGSQFPTAYISPQPVRFIIEYDDVDPRYTSVSLVLVRERIQGVPITPIDPSQPVGTMPARVAASAPASGTPGAQPASGDALGKATNAVNNVSDQKKKAQGLWQSVQGAVQPH